MPRRILNNPWIGYTPSKEELGFLWGIGIGSLLLHGVASV